MEREAVSLEHPTWNHICSIYRTRDEQFSVIVPFMLAGLRNNEKCIYIADEDSKEVIIGHFEKAEVGAGSEAADSMVFLTREDAYLKDGSFDPDRMIDLLRDTEKQALDQGYNGVRVAGEMTWIFTKLPGVQRLIEYEANLNHFLPESKCKAVCQYDENRFSPDVLLEVLHTHPLIGLHGKVYENPYFIPPDLFLARLRGNVAAWMYEKAKDDIIQRAELEREKTRTQKALGVANEKLSMLNQITRHDIENQLYAITAFSGFAKKLASDHKVLEYLDEIERAAGTIDMLLEFTKAYQDLGTREPVWVDLKRCISRAAASLDMKGVGLHVGFDGLEVYADPMLERVFYNLIDNAVRHGGKVTRIGFHHEGDGKHLLLVCEDDGIGVSEDDKRALFEHGRGKNTGVGLSLVREVLGITDMTIEETGTPGKGARFEIRVPAKGYRWAPHKG